MTKPTHFELKADTFLNEFFLIKAGQFPMVSMLETAKTILSNW